MVPFTIFTIGVDTFYVKNGASHMFFLNITRRHSDDSLSIEKTLTLCNITIPIKSVLNKNQNLYYNNII